MRVQIRAFRKFVIRSDVGNRIIGWVCLCLVSALLLEDFFKF